MVRISGTINHEKNFMQPDKIDHTRKGCCKGLLRFEKKFTSRASAFVSNYAGDFSELMALVNEAADSLYPRDPKESETCWEHRQAKKRELIEKTIKPGNKKKYTVRTNGKYRIKLEWITVDRPPTERASKEPTRVPLKEDVGKTKLHRSRYLELDIVASDRQNR